MITGHIPELIIVLVLGLIFFGPKRLPEVGEAMGRGIRDFKKGLSHLDVDHASQPVPTESEPNPAEPVRLDRPVA